MSDYQRIRDWVHGLLAEGERPSVDELLSLALEEPDLIGPEYLDRALVRAFKADVRQMAREDDAEGLPFALSIARLADGQCRREYAALSFFDEDDYVDALASARKRVISATTRYEALARKAHAAAGVQLVLPTIRWKKAS